MPGRLGTCRDALRDQITTETNFILRGERRASFMWVLIVREHPSVIHGSTDGTGVPVRSSETVGRRGRAEDGVARTREAKVVTFQVMEKDGEGRFRTRQRRVDAAIESASTADLAAELSPFARRVQWWAKSSGYDRARRQVLVADGAAWIWNLWDELFPDAVQILDLYHVRERLRGVANAKLGNGQSMADKRRRW